MNENQVEGRVNKAAGHIQDAAGALPGGADHQAKGKARAAAGDVQAIPSDDVDRLREWAATRPLSAVVIGASVAFLLGRLTADRD